MPKQKIPSRATIGSRMRMRKLRERRRERDPIEFHQVPVRRSMIEQIISKLTIDRKDDKEQLTDKEFDKILAKAIAASIVPTELVIVK